MRFINYKDWPESAIDSRLNLVRKQITALENERGSLVGEKNRRTSEVARVKKALTRG